MGLAWGVSFYLTRYLIEKDDHNSGGLAKLYLGAFISSWIGAKLFFLLLSNDQNISLYITSDSFWLGGGFVFYGGLVFGLIFFYFYSVLLKYFSIQQSRYLLPGIAFGHAIGRIGCFMAGCCYGNQCDLPWSVHMHGQNIHPVQIYEVIGLVVIGALMIKLIKEKGTAPKMLLTYLMSYALLRFFIEFFRGDTVRGIYWLGLSSSQLIALIMCFICAVVLTYQNVKKE